MRLIDTDELEPISVPIAPLFPDEEVHYEQVYLKSEVDEQPTIEKPKGKWLPTETWNDKCSICNKKAMFNYNYCPNCGAIMDGAIMEVDSEKKNDNSVD